MRRHGHLIDGCLARTGLTIEPVPSVNLVRDHVVARLFGAPVKWEKG